jgi:DNA-binding MarR family transcriptional regulator
MISEAIDEYISLVYTKKVKPLLNMRNVKGKSKYTPQSATKQIKTQIYKNYIS